MQSISRVAVSAASGNACLRRSCSATNCPIKFIAAATAATVRSPRPPSPSFGRTDGRTENQSAKWAVAPIVLGQLSQTYAREPKTDRQAQSCFQVGSGFEKQ